MAEENASRGSLPPPPPDSNPVTPKVLASVLIMSVFPSASCCCICDPSPPPLPTAPPPLSPAKPDPNISKRMRRSNSSSGRSGRCREDSADESTPAAGVAVRTKGKPPLLRRSSRDRSRMTPLIRVGRPMVMVVVLKAMEGGRRAQDGAGCACYRLLWFGRREQG